MYLQHHKRKGKLAADTEMWEALKEGEGLNEILENFYTRVYQDEKLSGFFVDVTQQRAMEKTSSFFRSIFTGEKCYFGDHPKKAHNWMVISDELFDYREQIMEKCLIEYGLANNLIKRWRELEEVFRKVIVKSQPLEVKIGNFKKPTEGYIVEKLEIDSICDKCFCEIKADTNIMSHIRTGKIYCSKCEKELDMTIYLRKNNGEYEVVK